MLCPGAGTATKVLLECAAATAVEREVEEEPWRRCCRCCSSVDSPSTGWLCVCVYVCVCVCEGGRGEGVRVCVYRVYIYYVVQSYKV